MHKRWAAAIAGGVVLALGGVTTYLLLVFRTCDQVRDTPRGSFDFRLCGLSGELIARIPIVAPASEPLYSWTLADGTKPGRNLLKYESLKPPATLRATLAEFLQKEGFSERNAEADYEWWTDRHTELGLSIREASGGSQVEVLHNTGNE